jgi:hypothetical protein
MYKVHLFHYKTQLHTVFNINSGNQGSPITFYSKPSSQRYIMTEIMPDVDLTFVFCCTILIWADNEKRSDELNH